MAARVDGTVPEIRLPLMSRYDSAVSADTAGGTVPHNLLPCRSRWFSMFNAVTTVQSLVVIPVDANDKNLDGGGVIWSQKNANIDQSQTHTLGPAAKARQAGQAGTMRLSAPQLRKGLYK